MKLSDEEFGDLCDAYKSLVEAEREEKRVAAVCGARCRSGQPCRRKKVPCRPRCPNHGGLSTGAKTAEGRAAIAESNRRRRGEKRKRGGGDLMDA